MIKRIYSFLTKHIYEMNAIYIYIYIYIYMGRERGDRERERKSKTASKFGMNSNRVSTKSVWKIRFDIFRQK